MVGLSFCMFRCLRAKFLKKRKSRERQTTTTNDKPIINLKGPLKI